MRCAENGFHEPYALRALRRLSTVLVVVMVTQASLGMVLPTAYRDTAWIRATWFGNDCVTLIVAVPLLVVANELCRPDLPWFGKGSWRTANLGYADGFCGDYRASAVGECWAATLSSLMT